MAIDKQYVLVTPARNEEKYIDKTLQAVLSQTFLPKRWVIVSNGSTDQTDELVKYYARKCKFIELINLFSHGTRNFGSKVEAFNAGHERLKGDSYDFIGNLDADVSFDNSYFEKIIKKFELNSKLGIAGGIILEEIRGNFVPQRVSLNSVAGAVQFFRRECYEAIGGYIPMEHGGVDAAAEILARMNGWEAGTFPEVEVLHHRRVLTGKKSVIHTKFYQGLGNYLIGYHPLFQIASALYRISDRPFFFGSMSMLAGFCFANFRSYKKKLPNGAIRYLRSEQMQRLKAALIKGIETSRNRRSGGGST